MAMCMSGSIHLHTDCMQNSKASSLAQTRYCLPLQTFVMLLIDSTLGSHHIPANVASTLLDSSQNMWSTHSAFCYYSSCYTHCVRQAVPKTRRSPVVCCLCSKMCWPDLQEYREQRAEELMGVLSSLWEALEVEQEDVDRGIFARLMSGPARLHGKSIQKVVVAQSVTGLLMAHICILL